MAQPLPPALLYRRCEPAELPFELCSELEEAPGLIGQERAVEALQFALRIRGKGYNVYALGAGGTGRHSMVDDLLHERAAGDPTPPDWCYVNNFDDPQQPHRLQLPPGRGAGAGRRDEAADRGVARRPAGRLRTRRIPGATRGDRAAVRQRTEQAFGAVQQRAQAQNITLMRTPTGLAVAPSRDGKVLAPEAFNELPAAERERIQHEIEAIQHELEETMRDVPQWEREHRDAVQALNRETAGFAIAHLIEELRGDYAELPEVGQYLDAVEQRHQGQSSTISWRRPPGHARSRNPARRCPAPVIREVEDARFRRYQVNVIVDNGGRHGAPVVYEDNPTHQTLVGRVEHLARFGALVTDFNLLVAGALHRANGGYLVLDAQKLLTGNARLGLAEAGAQRRPDPHRDAGAVAQHGDHGVAAAGADPARPQGRAGRAAGALLPAQRAGRGIRRAVQDRRRFRGPGRAHAGNDAALRADDLRDDPARGAAAVRPRRASPASSSRPPGSPARPTSCRPARGRLSTCCAKPISSRPMPASR